MEHAKEIFDEMQLVMKLIESQIELEISKAN